MAPSPTRANAGNDMTDLRPGHDKPNDRVARRVAVIEFRNAFAIVTDRLLESAQAQRHRMFLVMNRGPVAARNRAAEASE
jgi:hypothetical protein